MVKRYKIGLIYSYNNDWIAGSYYILNLIHAINRLEDFQKPLLVILANTRNEFLAIKNTGYPYLQFEQLNENDLWPSYRLIERIINKISRVLIKKNSIHREHTYKRLAIKIDMLFPADNNMYFSKVKKKLFWIPDFQEHFLPDFFSEKQISIRKNHQNYLVSSFQSIVFSSNDALSHFKKLYPLSKSKVFVLPFSVTHPDYKSLAISGLLKKYEIERSYFFCPNQFWEHKNHFTLLKALSILKKSSEKEVLVVFSGKEHDARNPDFFSTLKKYVDEHQLHSNVKFLGFIDREDQLQLMNHAIAVVQPSLFEGWSTVVEDAKSMNQFIIASDLGVHREQLVENVEFFEPLNSEQLAAIISKYNRSHPLRKNSSFYNQDIENFGKNFIQITAEVVRDMD